MRLLDRFDDPVALRPAPPARTKTRHICIFGDSQIGALKRAQDEGLARAKGYEIEYFGAPGPEFRKLHLVDGTIVPDQEVLELVQKVNPRRSLLDPAEFDAVVFFGARLRMREYMQNFLHHFRDPGAHVSEQVRLRTLDVVAQSARFARAAFDMAARGHAVYFAAGPFHSEGVAAREPLRHTPMAAAATAADRDALWREVEAYFAERGVTFLRQPDETVVGGALTDPRFAIDGAAEIGDAVHKTAEYGKIVFDQLFDALESAQKSAK